MPSNPMTQVLQKGLQYHVSFQTSSYTNNDITHLKKLQPAKLGALNNNCSNVVSYFITIPSANYAFSLS